MKDKLLRKWLCFSFSASKFSLNISGFFLSFTPENQNRFFALIFSNYKNMILMPVSKHLINDIHYIYETGINIMFL